MLLTITTTRAPATDLGFLLAKHPGRAQRFELPFGEAHVFYPEAAERRCTAALVLDIPPVGLKRLSDFPLEHYVNDRPYVASSFMSVALAQVYRSALGGQSRDRPELASQPLPLTARVAVVSCRGGEEVLRSLFAPLGYELHLTRHPLDPRFPEWGPSGYYTLELTATLRLQELLSHLYVLLPVLDDYKHYYVGTDEVEKLLRHGQRWLAGHPARALIAERYLRHQKSLQRMALERLVPEAQPVEDPQEEQLEERVSLNEQRMGAVLAALKETRPRSVLDLGCGEGRLLGLLLKERRLERIVGLDVSLISLERAERRLRLERLPPRRREQIELWHGSLIYRDRRLEGFDAAAAVEVIEHLEPHRLQAFEDALFACARPGRVVLTTPNAEYNALWPTLPAGRVRHRDHRFEWTRLQLQDWARGVAERHGYRVDFRPVGPEDPERGSPTQMAVFDAD